MAAPQSWRDRIRASERAMGYHVAQGSQPWASMPSTGSRRQPTRSIRQPTPLPAPPTPVAFQAASVQAAAAQAAHAMLAEAAAEQEHDHEHDHTPYESDATETYEQVDAEEGQRLGDPLLVLQLEQQVAQLRLEVHALEAELARQRRLRNEQSQLRQLATGPYWISRSRR